MGYRWPSFDMESWIELEPICHNFLSCTLIAMCQNDVLPVSKRLRENWIPSLFLHFVVLQRNKMSVLRSPFFSRRTSLCGLWSPQFQHCFRAAEINSNILYSLILDDFTAHRFLPRTYFSLKIIQAFSN